MNNARITEETARYIGALQAAKENARFRAALEKIVASGFVNRQATMLIAIACDALLTE